MNSGTNFKNKRTKKSSSINLIIWVVVGLLLCVGVGFLYASMNDTLQTSTSKNNEKQEQKSNQVNNIDWNQNSIESQRKIDSILLSQQNWRLSEQKNTKKIATYMKDKTIIWKQREIIIGVPNITDLGEAIKWFESEINKKKLYVLNKKEKIFKAKTAYELDIAMNNKIDSKALNCVTDKILFYNSGDVVTAKNNLLDKKKDNLKEGDTRVISIIPKDDNADFSKDSSIKAILPIIKTNANKKGSLAIVIDDSGYSNDIIKEFADMPMHLTFSVLPFLPESKTSLNIILDKNKEAMLHLPMEPINKKLASFDKMVTVDMTKEECQNYLIKALDYLPGVIGVNNHQGSKATSNKYTMKAVLEVLKERKLFFVDSRTYSKSIAYATAKDMGVKTAKNSMFLDNSDNVEDIKDQIRKSIEFTKDGQDVIVICHARPNSYKALKEIYPELLKEKVDFKFVSDIVK